MSKAIGRTILTINAGSSSLKFAFFASGDTLSRTFHGHIARIGSPDAVMTVQDVGKQDWSQPIIAPDHAAAAHTLVDWIDKRHDTAELTAVGHRIVHGGPKFCEPQRLTPDTINALRGIGAFDPQHLPQELLLIEAFQQRYRDIPQFACFDTAFFHNLPRVAQMLPIPRRYEARGATVFMGYTIVF